MKFLSKLGQIVITGLKIVTGWAPTAESILPSSAGTIQVISKDLAQMATVISDAEIFGQSLGLAGPDKLRAAAAAMAQVILASSILIGHQVENGPLFTQGSTKIADGLADVLNSLKADNLVVQDKAA